MASIDQITERDGPEIVRLKPPVQRAAYSDRTAWQMAILAELAYVNFETANDKLLEGLAKELLELNDTKKIAASLLKFRELLKTPNPGGEEALRAVLKVAGFELVGTFFNQSIDILKNTEGYVAKRAGDDGRDFAVLAIRGTTSPQDWMKNAKSGLKSIGGGKRVHAGFDEAFHDAKDQIKDLLNEVEDLPLFITGHSLGGAVAIMATWHFKRDTLAACYTFGSPRVRNHKFNDCFHTPIYRIVNSMDPVPMVPPTDTTIVACKTVTRAISIFFKPAEALTNLLTNLQGYRHAGDLRHMTDGEADEEGLYPTVKFHTQFGLIDRANRAWRLMISRQMKRLDIYHQMAIYRSKLRSRALERAPRA